MPTLPGPGFVEAVNTNGEFQLIPESWLADGSPFADQFRLKPSAVARAAKASRKNTTDAPPAGVNKKE